MSESSSYTEETVLQDLIKILKDMTSDWDLDLQGGIGPETNLISDLGFESIDVVQFIVGVEEHFHRRDLPFEKLLMKDGRYVDDLHVKDAARFLCHHLNALPAGRTA